MPDMPAAGSSKLSGAVIWITGMSGVGKTTIAKRLVADLRADGHDNVIHLDGDELRAVLGATADFDTAQRQALAMTYARLCQMLAEQGQCVVISTISLFHAVQDWNRQNLAKYHEVFVTAPLAVLAGRDPKGIYARAREQGSGNVVGLDQNAQTPRNPDLAIVNGDDTNTDAHARAILHHVMKSTS